MPTKRDTIVTSLRIPRDTAQVIRKDAQEAHLSFNALIMNNLVRYTEWERYTQKMGFVNIPRAMLRAVLEATDQETLNAIAKGFANSYRESISLWFKEVNLTTFLEFLRIASRYTGLFEYDIKSNGKNFTITTHHQLGEKWSKSYEHFASEVFKTCLGVDPIIEIGRSHAVIRFSVK